LIRCSHNRSLQTSIIESGEQVTIYKLFDRLPKTPETQIQLTIGHSGSFPKRDVTLDVSWANYTIANKQFCLVWARNLDENLDWKLLTTLPVNTTEEAQKILYYYHLRWLIERFHYTLKSGCQVEKLQLEEEERLFNALALYNVVATDILLLTYLARLMPNLTCLIFFSQIEWGIYNIYFHKED